MRRYIIIAISLFFLLLFIVTPLRQVYAPIRYRGLVKYYAQEYGVDWLLVSSIIYHESRFRYKAISNKGACGLMQIMPGTALEIARKLGWQDFALNNIFRPRVNLELGCYYLKTLLREFNGDTKLALAAYNAGRGSIYKAYCWNKGNLSYPSTKDCIYRYSDIQKYLPKQTRIYVSRVDSTYRLLKMFDKIWRL